MSPSGRLAELGLTLPPVARPAGAYVPAVRSGSLVYTAGQVALVDGKPAVTGKVGDEPDGDTVIDVDAAARMARLCTLNALAAVNSVVELDSVHRVIKVLGFVASAPGFGGQSQVLNGASELLGEVFDDTGGHARSAVGVAELPFGVPVEVELTAEVLPSAEAAT